MKEYNSIIEDLVADRWLDGGTGKALTTDIHSVEIEEDLDGAEADLIAELGFRGRLAVVSDANTYDAMGKQVARSLRKIAAVDSVVLDRPHAERETVRRVQEETRSFDHLIAVGSGTINDLCKYAAYLDGRRYAVFATAASMNGYATSTASITIDGFKHSLPARMPAGVFMDLKVISSAPPRLGRSGLGDSLCRSTAQVDWLLSHRLLGTYYSADPFLMQAEDETALLKDTSGLSRGDTESFRRLCRVLILCGLGTCVTGTSHHGSMSEHLISHYIDTFAESRHPGSLHGEQVGIASLSMNRLQRRVLGSGAPPKVKPTHIDECEIRSRCGPARADQCLPALKAKAFNEAQVDAVNGYLAERWPQLRRELQAVMLPEEALEHALRDAGAHRTAGELGIPSGFYREALVHAREIRNRFTILDIAADAGFLEEFAAGEN